MGRWLRFLVLLVGFFLVESLSVLLFEFLQLFLELLLLLLLLLSYDNLSKLLDGPLTLLLMSLIEWLLLVLLLLLFEAATTV